MPQSTEWTYDGYDGERVARTWMNESPRYVALLSHGYGEHIGRYEHVAATLVEDGAVVYGVDHAGHGKSGGERVSIPDYDRVVADFHELDTRARLENPGLPVVLIGHSMGGLIALRYAQLHGAKLAALVLSGPLIGHREMLEQILMLPEIPDMPIDTGVLSRDESVGTAYAEDPLVWHGSFLRPTLEGMSVAQAAIEQGKGLGALPTLWLHGEEDTLIPIDVARKGLEGLRGDRFDEKSYPGARHEIFNETNKDEVLADVTEFVGRVVG